MKTEQHNIFGGVDTVETDPLRDRFGEPPFTILRGHSPEWRRRKKQWLDAGIGRDDGREKIDATAYKGAKGLGAVDTDTSIFDPFLCELLVNWFSEEGDTIYDPFAGGSCRGLVAGRLKRKYVGVDVRKPQVEVNVAASSEFDYGDGGIAAEWIIDDSTRDGIIEKIPAGFDLMLSCPPYGNLEVYSKQSDDISNMSYAAFLERYRAAIQYGYDCARRGAAAVWVVGEYRDKNGHYVGFVPDTVRAFMDAGWRFYNEAIMMSPLGSAPQRAESQFKASKKLCKVHQNVLTFVK